MEDKVFLNTQVKQLFDCLESDVLLFHFWFDQLIVWFKKKENLYKLQKYLKMDTILETELFLYWES